MKHINSNSSGVQSVAKLFIAILVIVTLSSCGHRPTAQEQFQAFLDAHKQEWFNDFHPVGSAKRLQVHDVTVNKGQNGTQAAVRFTIYWEGPIQKNGFTKIRAIYDKDTNRFVRAEVLETNGITNHKVIEGLSEVVGAYLRAQ